MCLLKKGAPFVWDGRSQQYFNTLMKGLTYTPLLSPPDYNKYFLLYLATFDTRIGMVFLQTDDHNTKNVIYYLSKGLVGVELRILISRSLHW